MISFPRGDLEDWVSPSIPTTKVDCCASCKYGFVSRNFGGTRTLCNAYSLRSGKGTKTFYICNRYKRNDHPEEW